MTESELNEYSIFGLREIARRVGVASPTSKRKEDLISEILLITQGKQQPHVAKTRQGRPPKNYGYDFANSKTIQYSSSNIVMNQNVVQYDCSESLKTIEGYLDITDDFISVLASVGNKLSVFPMQYSFVEKYNLKIGDKLMVELEDTYFQKIVKDVLSVNGIPVAEFNTERKTMFGLKMCEGDILDAQLNLNYGDTIFVYGGIGKDNSKAVLSFVKDVKIDSKAYLNISMTNKDWGLLQGLTNTNLFVADLNEKNDLTTKFVNLSICYANRVAEMGKNILVVVDDLTAIKGLEKDLSLCKQLVSSAINLKQGGSITYMIVLPTAEDFGLLERVADKRLKIQGEKLVKF